MLDDIKKRFEFPNAVVQSQENQKISMTGMLECGQVVFGDLVISGEAVGHLIAAILKEKVSSKKIRQASDQEADDNLPVVALSLDVFEVRLDGDLTVSSIPAHVSKLELDGL